MTDVKGTDGVDKIRRHRNYWTRWTIAEIGEKLGRTASAVIRQASLVGVTGRGDWSDEEKAFLTKHYGRLSTQKIAARLGKSVSAVRAAVTRLELGKWHNVPWTEAELALMRAHYKKVIDGMKLLLPERTRGAIVVQAEKMGLTGTRLWLPDEDRVIS
ncbi:hypothetical protein ACV1BL_01685 [Serratia marcescens]